MTVDSLPLHQLFIIVTLYVSVFLVMGMTRHAAKTVYILILQALDVVMLIQLTVKTILTVMVKHHSVLQLRA